MELLSPREIARWYRASLAWSGYAELSEPALALWRGALRHGCVSLPPGLAGSILERLTHAPAGARGDRARDTSEEQLLALIAASPHFQRLEGDFILMGSRAGTERALAALLRIASRAGRFHHPAVYFEPVEVDAALALACGTASSRETLDANAILTEIYADATEQLLAAGGSLDAQDLFEIRHPHLFTSPGASALYRRMESARREIVRHIGGDLTLPEESADVVHHYGEPQALPMGGFDAFTHRGELSSLVPSELALIDPSAEIDCFDHKYLANELLYFSREEGVVFRIRRHIFLTIDCSPGMEHQRNLAWLMAFLACFVERTLTVLAKDAVHVDLLMQGHLPTDLVDAIQLLDHLLDESRFQDSVTVRSARRHEVAADPRRQCIHLGEVQLQGMRHVPFRFPEARVLTQSQPETTGRSLASLIDHLLEATIHVARR